MSAQRLARVERWLPLMIGVAWWAAMYPGLFGEDSLMTLTEARDGPVSVWFTAWWIYVIRFLTAGTRVIPLLTLFGVCILTFAVRQWAAACFPAGLPRTVSIGLLCATPLVGALGIQVRHDIEMTAGLLLCAAVAARMTDPAARFMARDVAQLVLAALLIATRHNGWPTVAAAAVGLMILARSMRARQALMLSAVAAGAFAVTLIATRASGHDRSIDPMQSVEWAIADVSCLLSKDAVTVTPNDWAALTKFAGASDWPQRSACRFMDKELFHAPSFRPAAVAEDAGGMFDVWLNLARANPAKMAASHIERMRLFLPPIPGLMGFDNMPFIHSTILPNDFGLEWRFPRVAETVRLAARAWNAAAMILANAGLWLVALIASRWHMGDAGRTLVPSVMLACVLELGILATAPMSEGRYGLFILICGQLAVLVNASPLIIR